MRIKAQPPSTGVREGTPCASDPSALWRLSSALWNSVLLYSSADEQAHGKRSLSPERQSGGSGQG
jgi:hypothetical protein